jgi:hypothetical protein
MRVSYEEERTPLNHRLPCNSFQINAVAFSTFLKRLAAVVRSRIVAKGDSTMFIVLKCEVFPNGV